MWYPRPERIVVLLSLLAIVVGFGLLVGGANLLVDGACQLAARFGMPERVAGLTVVAIGTSLPELVVSITSAAAGHADMAFGNVVGSCLANLLLILGLSAVIAPVVQAAEAPAASIAPAAPETRPDDAPLSEEAVFEQIAEDFSLT